MALGTNADTLNAAAVTFMAAWEAYTDTLGANADIRIVWVASKKGSLAADTTQGVDTTVPFDMARQYHWTNNPNTADSTVFEIGGRPLFWKLTNAAGDL